MKSSDKSKIQLSLMTFGVIIGLVGLLHGGSELVQGSRIVETNSLKALAENWPNQYFYEKMEGEPAFSIITGIPFYLLGIMAIIASLAMIIHSWFFIDRKHGLLIFTLLNLVVFFFGAGIGTPIAMGVPLVLFGIIATRFNKKKERSESENRLNLTLFKVFYWLQIFSWVLFFPGLVIVSSFGKIPEPLFMFDFMIMPISILGALIFGLRYDNTIRKVEKNE